MSPLFTFTSAVNMNFDNSFWRRVQTTRSAKRAQLSADMFASVLIIHVLVHFVPVGEGVPFDRGRQKGASSLKRRYFAAIGSYSVKRLQIGTCTELLHIITSSGEGLTRFVNIDDLEQH